jgi:hypothetical protein
MDDMRPEHRELFTEEDFLAKSGWRRLREKAAANKNRSLSSPLRGTDDPASGAKGSSQMLTDELKGEEEGGLQTAPQDRLEFDPPKSDMESSRGACGASFWSTSVRHC